MRLVILLVALVLTGCTPQKRYELGDITIQDLPVAEPFWNVSANGRGAGTYLSIEDFTKLGGVEQTLMQQPPRSTVSIHLTNGDESHGWLLLKGWPMSSIGKRYGLLVSKMTTNGGDYTVYSFPAGRTGFISCPPISTNACLISFRHSGLWLTSSVNRDILPNWSKALEAFSKIIDEAIVSA